MDETYEYLWTTEKDNYILLSSIDSSYSIFNITNNTALIIEDNEEYEIAIKKMKQNRNRIVRIELLKYILYKRPIPTLIGIQGEKALYRCPDTGEKFELDLEYQVHVEPEFDLAIRWSKDISITKQIVQLTKVCRGIEISTPDLLHLARKGLLHSFNKERPFICATCIQHTKQKSYTCLQ